MVPNERQSYRNIIPERRCPLATEQTKPKKPPAHEVIVAILRNLGERWRVEFGGREYESHVHVAHIVQETSTLLTVLMRMHIPENARQVVISALQHLPPQMIASMAADVYAEIEGDKGGA